MPPGDRGLPVKTSVVNMKAPAWPVGAVCIDRRTKWGNPFRIGPDGTRAEVLAKYREYILHRPDLMAALPELKGKVLACWCAPLPCHGHILAELADAKP